MAGGSAQGPLPVASSVVRGEGIHRAPGSDQRHVRELPVTVVGVAPTSGTAGVAFDDGLATGDPGYSDEDDPDGWGTDPRYHPVVKDVLW